MAGDQEKPGDVELSGEALKAAGVDARLNVLESIVEAADQVSAEALDRLKVLSEMKDEVGDQARAHIKRLKEVFGLDIDLPGQEGVDVDEDEDRDMDAPDPTDTDTDEDEEGFFDKLSKVFQNSDGDIWDDKKSFFENIGNFFENIPAALGTIWDSITGLFSGKKRKAKKKAESKETTSKAPLKAEDIRLIGASLMVTPGKNLEIDGEKIPEGKNEVYVKGGRPTAEMYENMKKEVEDGKFANVKAVAILAGGNDIGPRPASHVIGYLEKMIELFRGVNPDMKFVFVGLPPVTGYHPEVKVEGGGKERRYVWSDGEANERAKEINAWIHKMAEGDVSIAEVDLYSHLEDSAKPGWIKEEYNGDGLHLNSKGYEYLQTQLLGAFDSFEKAPV